MEARLNAVESGLAAVKRGLEGVETRLEGVETRLDGVENELADFKRSAGLAHAELAGKVHRIEVLLDDRLPAKGQMARLDKLANEALKAIEAFHRDRITIDRAGMRHQDAIDDHERRLRRLEKRDS